MAELRKYGAAAQIDGIPLITRGSLDYKANPTLAAGDVTISKDGGAFASIEGAGTFGDFVSVAPAAGVSVQVKPDATAMTCKTLIIKFVDQTTPKEWEDQLVRVETYGHASAMHVFDLGTAIQKVDVETIKTQAVTCSGAVTVGAKVGAAEVILFTGTGASAKVNAQIQATDDIDFSATQKTSLNAATPASVQNVPVDGTLKVDLEHIKTQDVVCAAPVTVLASVGTAATSTAQTGDSYAIVNGDHGLVSIQDDVDAIKAVTDKTDTALVLDGAVYKFTANALEEAPTGGGATAEQIADAVFDEALGAHTGLLAVALPNAAPGANGGLPTTNGTKLNQTVDLTAGQSVGISGDFSDTMKTSLNSATPTISDTAANHIADHVWDEPLSSHNIKNSAAAYAKKGGGGSTVTLYAGTAQAGAALSITLATDVPATANLLNQNLVVLTGGTGAGQTRRIVAYSAGRVCTVDRAWVTPPNATSTYEVMAAASSVMADEGTVAAATATTITLASSAPTGDGALDGAMVTITSGNGQGETKILSNYVGSTRAADVDSAWSVTPNTSSTYAVIPAAQTAGDSGGGTTAPTIQEIQSALLKNTSNPILTDADGHVTADVTGTVTVSGEVTLAASQPSYAPAKAGDAMTLTSAYDAAKTAATQASVTTIDGIVDTIDANVDTALTNQTTLLNRIGAFTGTGVNTILGFFKAAFSKIATLPTDIGGTFDPASDSLEAIREMETTINAAITSTGSGAGAITWTYTLTSTVAGGPPIADADVWVSTDYAGDNVVASGRTNQYGVVTFYLDSGVVYVWRQKSGYDFTNPDIETVS